MKVNLEVECSPWLNKDGTIEVATYFGNSCEPSLEESFLLKEMADSTLESLCVKNKIQEYHFDDVEELLTSLKDLYEYAKDQAEKLGYEGE